MEKLLGVEEKLSVDKANHTELKKSFYEACEDKEFLSFVKSLKISEDLLMKYTSTLKDAKVEWEHCKNCKGLEQCQNSEVGYCFTPFKEEHRISFSYVLCPYKKAESYKKNVRYFSVNKRIQNASMSSIYTNDKNRVEVIKYLKKYIESSKKEEKIKALYLHGSFGSGKTYLIAALFNELAKKGTRSIIIHVPELLRSMKESFENDYKERYHELQTIPLLLLDDIGAEYITPWARDEILEPLLQYRMEEELPTFFTSNFTLDQLESHFAVSSSGVEKVKGKRIIERILELAVPMELVSKNMRH